MKLYYLFLPAIFVAACAAPLRPRPRELAAEIFSIHAGDTTIGSEEVELKTTRNFGRTLIIKRSVRQPASLGIYQFDLNAAWTPMSVEMTSDTGARLRVEVISGRASRMQVTREFDGRSETTEMDSKWILCDSPASLLPMLRTLELEEGKWFRGECLYLQFDGTCKVASIELERVADRMRRVCYHLRVDGGEWRQVETDHRDWPLLYRQGIISIFADSPEK